MDRSEIKLVTFEGKTKSLTEIDDQHLCNIVHYSQYIGMSAFMYHYGGAVMKEIEERLGGEMLPYRPPIQHVAEIKYLQEEGMLQEKDGKVLIVKDGEVIGEVIGPTSRKLPKT